MKISALAIVRYGMAATFLWFGFDQQFHSATYIGFLPQWMGYMPIPGETVVKLNGWFEIVASVMLALGVETRVAAALLGAHLMGIAISVGDAIGVRDAGLAVATLALACERPDMLALDHVIARKDAAAASAQAKA